MRQKPGNSSKSTGIRQMISSLLKTMDQTGYVSYSQCKLDSQVLPLAKAAAALKSVSVQEWLSDAINEAAAKELGMKPIKRRKPKPKAERTKPSPEGASSHGRGHGGKDRNRHCGKAGWR